MRWPSVHIPFGTERMREGFLWLPKRLSLTREGYYKSHDMQWRWLEYAQWVEWRGTYWYGKHWS